MRVCSCRSDATGRRRYGEHGAYRVAVIVASKAAGMSLEQIRALVDGRAADRQAILEAHLADICSRIEALERSRRMAAHALECRAHDIANCPRFRANAADIVAGSRTGLWHDGHPLHAPGRPPQLPQPRSGRLRSRSSNEPVSPR